MLRLQTTLTALFLPALVAGGFAACSASSALVVSDDGGEDGSISAEAGSGEDGSTIIDEDSGSVVDGSKPGDGGTKDSGDAKADVDSAVVPDAARDCGAAPTLHPSPSAGVFCPFQANDASVSCSTTPGTHCCIYPKAANKPATCNTLIQGCDVEIDAGGSDFECDEPADCVGGQVCCMDGKALKDPVCYYYGSVVRQTKCRAGACNAGEIVVCSAQAQCASGTCTPMDTKGKELGVCVP